MGRGQPDNGRLSSLGVSGAAVAAPGGVPLPIRMTAEEISALVNSWPNRPDHKIIPHKPHKREKRVLLPIAPDYELDVDPFQSAQRAPVGKLHFIHASGGREEITLPYRVGTRLYVDEMAEVIDRPEGDEWVRIRYLADDERRILYFGEGEERPKLGIIRFKHLPLKFARGDRMEVTAVRVARLWDIQEAEAEAEGVHAINARRGDYFPNATRKLGFEANWNQLHAPIHSFSKANWWVAVLSIKRDFDDA